MKIIFSKEFSWRSHPLFLGYMSSPPQLHLFWLFNLCVIVARPKYSRTLWHTITFPLFHPIKQYQHWQRWRHHPLYKTSKLRGELARWAGNVGWWWEQKVMRFKEKIHKTPAGQHYFFTHDWQVVLTRHFHWKGHKMPWGISRAEVAGAVFFFSLAIYWIKRLDRP